MEIKQEVYDYETAPTESKAMVDDILIAYNEELEERKREWQEFFKIVATMNEEQKKAVHFILDEFVKAATPNKAYIFPFLGWGSSTGSIQPDADNSWKPMDCCCMLDKR